MPLCWHEGFLTNLINIQAAGQKSNETYYNNMRWEFIPEDEQGEITWVCFLEVSRRPFRILCFCNNDNFFFLIKTNENKVATFYKPKTSKKTLKTNQV